MPGRQGHPTHMCLTMRGSRLQSLPDLITRVVCVPQNLALALCYCHSIMSLSHRGVVEGAAVSSPVDTANVVGNSNVTAQPVVDNQFENNVAQRLSLDIEAPAIPSSALPLIPGKPAPQE